MCPTPPPLFLLTSILLPSIGSCHPLAAGRKIHVNTPWLLQCKISQVVLNRLLCLIHLKNGQLWSEYDEGCAVIFSAARAVTSKERDGIECCRDRSKECRLEWNTLLLQLLSDHRLSLFLLKFIKLITPLKFRLDSEIVLTLKNPLVIRISLIFIML